MATGLDLPCPPKFNIHTGLSRCKGNRWNHWQKSFNIYLGATNITDATRKKNLLLHCAATDVKQIFETSKVAEATETNKVYQIFTAALDRYFQPKVNKSYEHHIFRSSAQKKEEYIDQYVTRLHTFSKFCEFYDARNEFVDQVIEKCSFSRLRKRLLR